MSFLLSHRSIFLAALTLQFLDRLLDHIRKGGGVPRSSEQIRIRQEINQLLREANSLSTPSTFAQATKLKRLAAAKEKELLKFKEGQSKEKKWLSALSGRNLFIAKVVLCLWLSWQFWGVPVVMVPPQLLQPFGKIFSWSTTDPSTGLVPVGIIPWLILSSGVSNFLCQKFSKLLHL